MNTKRKEINVRLNDKEYEMVKLLKENYAINISGAFKLFLKKMVEDLKK